MTFTVEPDYFGAAIVCRSDDATTLALCVEHSPAWSTEHRYEDAHSVALWVSGDIPSRDEIEAWVESIQERIEA